MKSQHGVRTGRRGLFATCKTRLVHLHHHTSLTSACSPLRDEGLPSQKWLRSSARASSSSAWACRKPFRRYSSTHETRFVRACIVRCRTKIILKYSHRVHPLYDELPHYPGQVAPTYSSHPQTRGIPPRTSPYAILHRETSPQALPVQHLLSASSASAALSSILLRDST
jgi:hypothetical protein